MKLPIRKILTVLALAVFIGSVALVGYQQYQYSLGDKDYSDAQSLVGMPDFSAITPVTVLPDEDVPLGELPTAPQSPSDAPDGDFDLFPTLTPNSGEAAQDAPQEPAPEPEPVWIDPYADALNAMDFTALQEVNSEVLGWIFIPDTVISYPLVQGDDNQKYLKTTWRGGRSSVGSIFLECRNSADFSDFNTIIYGHNMANGSMFGSLKKYSKLSYWEKHPHIYITDDNGTATYEVFAAYEAPLNADAYRLSFNQETTREKFIASALELSVIDTGITPTTDSDIITLSTCTGRGHETRWVVQAVRVEG